MTKKIQSVEDLIKLAGGSTKLGAFFDMTQAAIEYWRSAGIPEKHWKKIWKEYGISFENLNEINERLRNANQKT